MDSEFDHRCRGNESRLTAVKMAAEQFIKQHYTQESPFFDAFWQVLSSKIRETFSAASTGALTIGFPRQLVEAVSLARDISLDLVTPIVMGTIGETPWELKDRQPHLNELEQLVAASAVRLGASPSLTACLIEHVPGLLMDILACESDDKDAIIGKAYSPQYSIWTAGKHFTAEGIAEYEERRDQYLFWLDLRDTCHVSHRFPHKRIGRQATQLLICLVKNLGVVRSAGDVFRQAWEPETDEVNRSHIGRIEHELSNLNKFSGNKLRTYLLRGQDRGYGLHESFAGQYFLFERLR